MKETTQFSIVEYRAFEAKGFPTILRDGAMQFETHRHKAMAVFADFLKTAAGPLALEVIGGIDNLQRVRVFGPSIDGGYSFVLVEKLPLYVLKQKKADAEMEKAKAAMAAAVKAEMERLAKMPMEEFLQVLAKAGSDSIKPKSKPIRPAKPNKPRPDKEFLQSPKGAKLAYDEALKQDQAQRRAAIRKGKSNPKTKQETK